MFKMILWLVSIPQLIGTPCIKQTHMKPPVSSFKDQVKGEQSIQVLMQVSRHSSSTPTSVMLAPTWPELPESQGMPSAQAPCTRSTHEAEAGTLVSESSFFHIRPQPKGMGFEAEDWV